MKAMLLAGGLGTRLKSITSERNTPKCMIPIHGKPLIEYNIDWMINYGITDFIINLHDLPEIVMNYFGSGKKWGINISYSIEEEPLGTAGGVKILENKLNDKPFLVWYADNLSNCKLGSLISLHNKMNGIGTTALYNRTDGFAYRSSTVNINSDGLITSFIEKPNPQEPYSTLIGAGIIVFEPEIFDYILPNTFQDFGKDIFPKLIGNFYGYKMGFDEGLWWIDTEQDLNKIETLFNPMQEEMNG